MPQEQLKTVTAPRLVIDEATMPWTSTVCHVLAVLPHVTRATLDSQPHDVDLAASPR